MKSIKHFDSVSTIPFPGISALNESENVYVYVSVKCSTFIILMEWKQTKYSIDVKEVNKL